MKRFTAIILTIVMCMGLFAGCGQSYSAQDSTVFVLKNGKVVSTDVEEFDAEKYDEASLKEFINSEIEDYTSANGSDSVKLKSVKIEDGKATLTIEYATADDYAKFNGVGLFTGTLAEALAAGYSFDGDFASIDGGKATECDTSSFMKEDGLKVVVIKGNVNVNVPGAVAYVSVDGTKLVDANTVGIMPGLNLITGTAVVDTETSEPATEDVTEAVTEATDDSSVDEGAVDEGSVDEGDILDEGTEAAEVEFNFPEDTAVDSTSTYTNVYTFIIYK